MARMLKPRVPERITAIATSDELRALLRYRSGEALDHYQRRGRSPHPDSESAWQWLGKRGRYTPSGISQMVRDRGTALGIKLHPQAFRHWRASEYKSALRATLPEPTPRRTTEHAGGPRPCFALGLRR